MRTRHYGIRAECNLSLQLWKWTNKIVEFVEVTERLKRFGIADIEDKATRAQQRKDKIL